MKLITHPNSPVSVEALLYQLLERREDFTSIVVAGIVENEDGTTHVETFWSQMVLPWLLYAVHCLGMEIDDMMRDRIKEI